MRQFFEEISSAVSHFGVLAEVGFYSFPGLPGIFALLIRATDLCPFVSDAEAADEWRRKDVGSHKSGPSLSTTILRTRSLRFLIFDLLRKERVLRADFVGSFALRSWPRLVSVLFRLFGKLPLSHLWVFIQIFDAIDKCGTVKDIAVLFHTVPIQRAQRQWNADDFKLELSSSVVGEVRLRRLLFMVLGKFCGFTMKRLLFQMFDAAGQCAQSKSVAIAYDHRSTQ